MSKCTNCEKSFRADHLKVHLGICKKTKSSVCDICHKDFAKSSLMHVHMKKHRPDKYKQCDICGKGPYSPKVLLQNHKIKYHSTKPQCKVCKKTLATNYSLMKHMKAIKHKLFNEFERQYCSIAYKPARYLAMKKAYINRINLD